MRYRLLLLCHLFPSLDTFYNWLACQPILVGEKYMHIGEH